MRIAIVHYHLRRGGVTQVIATAAAALKKLGHEVVVLTGEAPLPEIEKRLPNFEVIPELAYRMSGSAVEIACEMRKRAGTPDLWHFHNHALGKNVHMPEVVAEIARESPVLLQSHDFAEDGRPWNFRTQLEYDPRTQLWPQASQIHYATINWRDLNILREVGFPGDRLSMLPNAVSELVTETTPADRPFAEGKKFYLYPTRAIRRKNVGELLLHAHLHRDEAEFATTLAPDNPDWLKIHRHWESMVDDLKLPVKLGNHGYDYKDLVGWCDAQITTSVAEGFGLAFLEPWLAGKSVVGRDLIDITADFPVNLNHLYGRFDVPLSLINEADLKAAVTSALEESYAAYGRIPSADSSAKTLDSMICDQSIDFGRLSEPFQTTILRNPTGVEPPPILPCSSEVIHDQTGLVRQSYSVGSYGDKLAALYQKVADSRIGEIQNPGPELLLDSFLDPARFNLLLS